MAGLSAGLGLTKTPNVIQRFKPADQLQLVEPATPETDAAAIQKSRELAGDFSSGLRMGGRGLAATAKAAGGQALRTVGATDVGQELIDSATVDSQNAQVLAPRVNRLTDIRNTGDAIDYAQAMAGQGIASTLPQAAIAAGTRGLGLGAARSFAATAGSVLPSTAGEALLRINADPATANLSDAEKMAIITGEGVAGAALESIVPAAIGGRAVGAGARLGAPSVAGALKTTGKDLLGEAATEAAQQKLGQTVQGTLNPNRDSSQDNQELLEAGAAGFFGAGPTSVLGTAAEQTLGRSVQAGQQVPTMVGKLNKFTSVDLSNLRKPQLAPRGVDPSTWLDQDDAQRNESATKLATVLSQAGDVSDRVKTAAQDYLAGSRTEAAWESLSSAVKNEERVQNVKDGIQAFSANVSKRVKAGVDTAKLDLAARAAEQRINKVTRRNEEAVPDAFDRLLSDNLYGNSNLSAGDDILNELPALTASMRDWISSDFSTADSASVSAPEGLTKVFADPVKAVTDAYDLMVRQGLVENKPELLKQVTQAIQVQQQQNKTASKIIADNVLPTAQTEYNLEEADYNEIADQVRRMLSDGDINEGALNVLFGDKKEVVLEALRPTVKTIRGVAPDVDETEFDEDSTTQTSDDVNYTDADSLAGSPNQVNTVGAKAKYRNEYDTSVPESERAAKLYVEKAETAGGQRVTRVGIVDSLRDQFGDNPDKFIAEVQKKIAKYGAKDEKELNRRVVTMKLEDADDSTEEIDIDVDSLKSITPKTTNNVWAINTGKNGEYGLASNGAIYFERVATDGTVKQFATSTSKLIAHARKGRAKGAVVTDKEGIADQLAMLKAGIASMLSVKHADGTPAISGRYGFVETQGQDVQWAKSGTKFPADLKLMGNFVAGDETLADKRKLIKEDRAELAEWLSRNEWAKWTDGDTKTLDREKPGPARDYLIQQRELANLVMQARAVGKSSDYEVLSRVLKNIDAYNYTYRDERDNKLSAGSKKVGNEEVAVTETDEMVDAANKKLDNKIRTNDEQTGALVQPPIAKPNPNENTANKKVAEQVAYLTKVLGKGIPAFNAFIATLKPNQVEAVRRTLTNMLEGKLFDALRNRTQRALDILGKPTPDPDKPTKSNKESIKQASSEKPADPEAVRNLSEAEQNEIRASLMEKLGPDLQIEFVKEILGAPRPDRAGPQISGEWTEGLIRISLNARNPAQVGSHEAMHEFFSRLNKSGLRDAQKTKDILLRAASNPMVVRQVEKLLAGSPNAIKQLKEGQPDFMEERLAYMYQFWHAGLIKLGPDTETIFGKIAAFIRRTITQLNDAEKADIILQLFDTGAFAEDTADVAAEVLAKHIELKEREANEAMAIFKPVQDRLSRFFLSAEANLMESDNPFFQKILTTFKNPTGVGVEQSLIEAKTQKMAQFTNKLEQAIGESSKEDLEEAVSHLHAGTKPKDEKLRGIYNNVRKLLDDMELYMREAKVQRMNEEGKWEDFGHIKNYYPRAYDISAITKDPAGFQADLIKHHTPELEAIVIEANKEFENNLKTAEQYKTYASAVARAAKSNKPLDINDVAAAITNRIINSMGQPDLSEDDRAVGYSPNARAINKRNLTWLDVSKFDKWMNKDLVEVMTTYIAQGTKRAESVRRFGNNSVELTKQVEEAFQYEKEKIVQDNASSTKPKDLDAETVDKMALANMAGPVKAIMALEGTIGYDINPRLQRLQGTILVYENLRTLGLSLFAQMVDPLGIMIRGGTMKEAFSTYGRGLKEIKASWTGKKIKDRDTEIAEFLGTVDSSGFLANFGQSYSSMYIHQKARKWNEAMFKYNGMDGFNRATRIVATQAAISFIKRQKTDPNYNTERYLRELLLTPEDIVIDEKGDVDYTNPKMQVAIKRWVDQAILRPNAAQRPAWMSDPHFALFGHMKQFSYSFHDVILKRAWLEAKNHGELGPLGILVAGFVPIMIAADAAKAILLTGKEPYWMAQGLPSMIEHGVQRAGLLGIASPYADPVTSGHSLSVLGPAGEQVVSLFTQEFEESAVDALPGASIINTIKGGVSSSKAESFEGSADI